MRVRHFNKNGVIMTDIDGHIVKRSDAKQVYNLIEKLNKRKGEEK